MVEVAALRRMLTADVEHGDAGISQISLGGFAALNGHGGLGEEHGAG